MKTITILGSTGSIGTQALEVAAAHKMKILALCAKSNVSLLASQAKEFSVKYVCIYDENKIDELKELLKDTDIEILCGMEGLLYISALKVDILLNSVVGMIGLLPTLTAIEAGNDIALANKETLVAGGELVMKKAAENGVKILPVDSEHSAIFQSLQGRADNKISKILLTASGGPFFGKNREELKKVTLSDALKHPNWEMGKKITIDSATLMNKGLEFIEAMWLFDVTPDQIEILVHRQSVVHSAVEYEDFSVIAQLGVPDMKIPIQYALTYPERYACPTKRLSLTDYATLTFAKPDYDTFDCLSSCIKAVKIGGTMPAMVNAANEEAVALFLDEKIEFYQIGEIVKSIFDNFCSESIDSVDDILVADKKARDYVKNLKLN